MAEVVVVGAGLGGLATAARLAKLGHRVTVCERSDSPGGLLRRRTLNGSGWDATPFQTVIPAVLRDLFHKTGRPIERYVDLQLSEPARRHVFTDGSVLDLPTGSRARQLDAVTGALGLPAAEAWTRFVDGQAEVWEALRTTVLDEPDGVTRLRDRRTALRLRAGRSLDRLVRKEFDDERLGMLAAFPAARDGRRPRDEPAFRAVESYLERTLGVWRLPGGASDLTAALLTRMAERSVDVRFETEVVQVTTVDERVDGVLLADGKRLHARLVVTATAPSLALALLDHPVTASAKRLLRAAEGDVPRFVTHLALTDPPPDLPREIVLHGDPLVLVATDPESAGWTVTSLGMLPDDAVEVLAARGLDIRGSITARLDVREESPAVLGWPGRRAAAARAELFHPIPGLFCLGTGLLLGRSVPYVAWEAAHVAALVGKA